MSARNPFRTAFHAEPLRTLAIPVHNVGMRGVLLLTFVSMSFAACNCGAPPASCTPANCTGCCDLNGDCQGGAELGACGSSSAACVACAGGQQCQLGFCIGAPVGGGTTTGGGAGGGGGSMDAGDVDAGTDAGFDAGAPDAGAPDAGPPDSGAPDSGTPDAGRPDAGQPDAGRADAGAPDAGPPDAGPTHVHIFITNTCVVSTQPASLTAPLNSGLKLDFHNHSVDYQADVWSSRGYGYLQLATGGLWHDPITHCGGPNPYTEYFDVDLAGGGGSACPGVRFNIRCQ